MKFQYAVFFLVLNFGALAIGALLMGDAVKGDWYASLNKAPWTPPGWVFGAAWFCIMLLFSFFVLNMSFALKGNEKMWFFVVFSFQWLLNVIWNPLFFRWHFTVLSLVTIIILTFVLGWLVWRGGKTGGYNGLLVLPYFIWLCIATSLNAYVVINN